MTNAEKFLKDGEDGIRPLLDKCREIGAIDSGREYRIDQMLREQVKPTLTEDERVILRNIDTDFYKGIGRENGTLYLVSTISNNFGGKNDREVFWYCFHELFQFIKERRKI